MKILVVDNGTIHLNKIKDLLKDHEHQVVNFSEIDLDLASSFDATILSGGKDFPVVGNEHLLEKEINFIKNYNKLIFGICFGFELISNTFGAELLLMKGKEREILNIDVIEPSDLFLNINDFEVFEAHRWVIKEVSDSLKSLARSKDCIEAIKHKDKEIYGVQFHPEMFINETCGVEIFNNFLKMVS